VGGGGGISTFETVTTLHNTIVAGNFRRQAAPVRDDIDGNVHASSSHNLIGDGTGMTGVSGGSNGNQVGSNTAALDARLGFLASNGGPTQTHHLLPDSPALDAGDNSLALDAFNSTLTTDQRGAGFARFVDSLDADATATVDIGALEADLLLEDVTDQATNEDTFASVPFRLGGQIGMSATSDNQTLVPNGNASFSFLVTGPSTRTLVITPAPNQFGTTTITLTVHGPQGQTLSDTFLLTVTPVNDFPTFTKGANQTVNEDAGPQTVLGWATNLSAGPPDESAQTLSFHVIGGDNLILFSTGPSVSPTGTLTYTPAANANGSATVSLVIKDNGGTANGGVDTSPGQTFIININAVNDAPAADAQSVTTDEDVAKAITLAGSDVEGGALTYTVTAGPTHGTLTGSAANRTYTPQANYNGSDSFKFKVNDGVADSAEATVSITVAAVNDAPVNSVPGAQSTSQNIPRIFSSANSNAITVSDVDAGADPMRFDLSATNGTLTLGTTAGLTFVTGDGADDATMTFTGTIAGVNAALNGLTFKPPAGFSGGANLQIVTDDQGRNGSGGAKSDTDSVTIMVNPGGMLQYSSATYETGEGSPTATITVTRVGGSSGAASVNFATANGTATGGASCGAGVDYINASGTLAWADAEAASKTYTVTVCNNSQNEPDETINLTLSGVTGSSTSGSPSAATLTIQDDDAAGGVIEFSQSTYTVGERAASVAIMVRRSGDTSEAANVNYATDDGSIISMSVPCSSTAGLALDRCDFTKALGKLVFAPGEAEKAFVVLVSDDSYVEGPETALLRLSHPGGGAVLGARTTATLEITDDAAESAGNPIDDVEKFVRQHYHDFLNREPDTDGLNFWVGQITVCGTDAQCAQVRRINVSAAFFLSIENQETGYLTHRAYKVAFGDLPGKPVPLTLEEHLLGSRQIGEGVQVGVGNWEQQLEANKVAFFNQFVTTSRFATLYSGQSNALFVDALNVNAGGALSSAERDALIADVNSAAKTRAQVLRAVAEDVDFAGEGRPEKNRAFVLSQYFGYLRRNPDDVGFGGPDPTFEGYNFWLAKLNQFNGNFVQAEMVRAFIESIEYRERFGR
jgi:hypothetical protein